MSRSKLLRTPLCVGLWLSCVAISWGLRITRGVWLGVPTEKGDVVVVD
jgi:hypothetical protein